MITTKITPQLSDIDSFQHVNYRVVHRWFEEGRLPIYKLFVPDLNLERLRLVMVRLEVDYLAEMFLGAEVEIRTSISKIGNTSFHITQEAYQNVKCCARGIVVLVHFDRETKESLPLTPEFRELLKQV